MAQFDVYEVLKYDEMMTAKQISLKLNLASSTVNINLNALIRKGMAERVIMREPHEIFYKRREEN